MTDTSKHNWLCPRCWYTMTIVRSFGMSNRTEVSIRAIYRCRKCRFERLISEHEIKNQTNSTKGGIKHVQTSKTDR